MLHFNELSFETTESFSMIGSPVDLDDSSTQEIQTAGEKAGTEGSEGDSLRGKGCNTEPGWNSHTGKGTGLKGLTFQGHGRCRGSEAE